MQDKCASGAFEYLPAAHALHVVAPGEGPLFVMEPCGQEIQLETDAGLRAEYLPAAHAVQELEPTELPSFVV